MKSAIESFDSYQVDKYLYDLKFQFATDIYKLNYKIELQESEIKSLSLELSSLIDEERMLEKDKSVLDYALSQLDKCVDYIEERTQQEIASSEIEFRNKIDHYRTRIKEAEKDISQSKSTIELQIKNLLLVTGKNPDAVEKPTLSSVEEQEDISPKHPKTSSDSKVINFSNVTDIRKNMASQKETSDEIETVDYEEPVISPVLPKFTWFADDEETPFVPKSSHIEQPGIETSARFERPEIEASARFEQPEIETFARFEVPEIAPYIPNTVQFEEPEIEPIAPIAPIAAKFAQFEQPEVAPVSDSTVLINEENPQVNLSDSYKPGQFFKQQMKRDDDAISSTSAFVNTNRDSSSWSNFWDQNTSNDSRVSKDESANKQRVQANHQEVLSTVQAVTPNNQEVKYTPQTFVPNIQDPILKPQIASYEKQAVSDLTSSDTKESNVTGSTLSSNELRNRFIIGKVVGEDILDSFGSVIITKNTIISDVEISKAEKVGMLSDLILNMKLFGMER